MRKNSGINSGLSSAANALRVLAFVADEQPIRLTEIARHLALAPSTTHRLLSCLAEAGFLHQRGGTKLYVAGSELLRISRQLSDQYSIERVARPFLEELGREVEETINLQVLVGRESICVDTVVEHSHTLRVASLAGVRTLAHTTAAGKVLLADLKSDELRSRFTTEPERFTHKTITTVAQLVVELEAVRRNGYAVSMEERESGVSAVSVPVWGLDQHPLAAMSIAAPSARLPKSRIERLLPHMKRASASISESFYAVTAGPESPPLG